ncbi:hypothetical protein [Devosia sp.]|uniref:hypothetical protein n=1 Tax=Devosia sp. TaxID=1871048 RepID=UPI001AC1EDEF|nr:hypothetical protein [Devosia sp.]MBN9332216.1 hypothetical protein [Devosia sp.]
MPSTLLVGGYGAVGSQIARTLASKPENHVIVAGRNLTKAAAIGFGARRIDLGAPPTWADALEGIDLVVASIDQKDTAFVSEVTRRGIGYIDVTAGDDFFRHVEALEVRTPVVLSLGLAPGLSNLLSAAAAKQLDVVESIEIGILMGTGDDHGSAAIAWSTRNMFDPKAPRDDARISFGPDFGMRQAHFMDFADQHVLARTMPGVRTVTRVTYDSAMLSGLLFWLGRTFAGNATMQALVERISHMPTLGSDKCVLSVTAHGKRASRPVAQDAFFFGRREAAVTAAVAALAAEDVLAGRVPPGIHHSHQVLDGQAIFTALERLGHGRVQFSDLRPEGGI